ncbi:MAG: Crp/Fnr family transcriptional regulator [Cyanobacteria bacterium J069]
MPHLEPVSLSLKTIVHRPGEPIEHVYFPHRALISLVTILEDGSTVENSLVGREGMVGIQAFLGNGTMPHQAIVQVPNGGVRMSLAAFKAEFNRNGPLHDLLLSYLRFLFIETAQGNACNSMHTVEERLARWLLNVSDRRQSNELPLTQEFIAQMLGIRRAGVTVAAGIFQQAGMIRYRRGNIVILDHESLKATTCECYQVIKTELDQLLGTEYS